jgi:undecaprenyl-phosphate galactose phosphotransferase
VPAALIILLLALFVFLETRSNPFYTDIRWGKHGKKFSVYKLRSMHKDGDAILKAFLQAHPEKQEEWRRFKKIKGKDPRLTRMGKILRKYSLDELPQIFNVFLGTMSFVGPRPYLPKEREDIGDYLDLILSVKPGITGLWQISGRNELEFSERLRFDYLYIKNWSLWLDFMILIKTTGVVLGGKGSY